MRKTKHNGGFFACLLFNALLNFDGTIPAWLLLAMHFIRGWSIWWAALALGLWLLGLILWMLFIGWANTCSTPDPPKENKNPYSVGAEKDITK